MRLLFRQYGIDVSLLTLGSSKRSREQGGDAIFRVDVPLDVGDDVAVVVWVVVVVGVVVVVVCDVVAVVVGVVRMHVAKVPSECESSMSPSCWASATH